MNRAEQTGIGFDEAPLVPRGDRRSPSRWTMVRPRVGTVLDGRRPGRRIAGSVVVASVLWLLGVLTGCSPPTEPEPAAATPFQIDHVLPSTPENLSWGWFPVDKDPALTIQSGATVEIHTLTTTGIYEDEHPVDNLEYIGIPASEVPDDLVAFWQQRDSHPREGRAGHLITGPVYIEHAEPGDTLEVQILEVRPRVPWGVNFTRAFSGVMATSYPGYREGDPGLDIPETPDEVPSENWRLIRTETSGDGWVGVYPSGIRVPLAPFMGILAVAPQPRLGQPGVRLEGVQSSGPPGPFGGNLDVKDLTAGTKVFLPVLHPGARFYVGDPHGAQGDGEVSGTAIEQSMIGVFRFVLHKGLETREPRGETPTHHLILGMDLDLDRALRNATVNVVDFLGERYGIRPSEAFSLASVAVDFTISEAVDGVQVVTGRVPKALFTELGGVD